MIFMSMGITLFTKNNDKINICNLSNIQLRATN